MAIVAGPQGSGKSTLFPVAATKCDAFNVDERRKQLNAGDSHNIPPALRRQSQRELQGFIEGHILEGPSLAFEGTLAREITFIQAAEAKRQGFVIHLRYLCTDDIAENQERVAARVENGGHGCSPSTLRNTYSASIGNLARAIREFDRVWAWDTTARGKPARAVLVAESGRITWLSPDPPRWLRQGLQGTEFADAGGGRRTS